MTTAAEDLRTELLTAAYPIYRIFDEAGQERWFEPDRRYTAPCTSLVTSILEHFRETRRADTFTETQTADDPREVIRQLVEAGFLRRAGAPREPVEMTENSAVEFTPVAIRLLNAPPWVASEARADVVVLGVPFDKGSKHAGAAEGPALLRRLARTFIYQVDPDSNRPIGFYDIRRRRRILQGAAIADAGDLATPIDSLSSGVRTIADCGALPVLLGGDHAITPFVLRGIARHTPVQVLFIDAHLDIDPAHNGPDHAAALRQVLLQDNVRRVIHAGARGFDDPIYERRLGESGHRLTFVDLAERPGEAVRAALLPNVPCYITFDVDVLEASTFPGAHYLVPGGVSLAQARDALRAAASEVPAAGIDFVELVPALDPRGVTGHACLLLLLEYLDSWWSARHG
jgi:agmatinase